MSAPAPAAAPVGAEQAGARRVLVTGGTGFVGPKVVHAIRAREFPVRALVRTPARAQQLESWGCELVEGDVTDPGSLRRAAEDCDVVVHLVALIAGRPQDFERVMIQGTRNVVDAAKAAGVRRFVLMSALGTNAENRSVAPYFNAKWEMEQAVEASGLEYVIFRPSFIFGRDGGILPRLLRILRLAPVTPVAGPGTQRVQPIWVEDVAEFVAKAVDLPEAANRTFELGGPDAVDWNELYSRMRGALGIRRPTLHVPFALMRAPAAVAERLPNAPLTRDQLRMLQAGDNTTDVRPAVDTFGQTLVPLDEQLRRAATAR